MNGVLIIDKEKDITSRDAVNKIQKKFNERKVGHTGTLDPIATGVLVICVGSATKLVELLTHQDKEYIGECTLGIKTDTLDITGNILEERDVHKTKKEIVDVLNSFKGEYNQEVPLYSSVKINGKKLCEYARNNIEVNLPKRLVKIKSIELLDIKYENNKTIFKFKCKVSKGTYIRSLIKDISDRLNTIGTMSDLRRTKVGKFDIKDAKPIDKITKDDLINIIDVLDIKKVNIEDTNRKLILNGSIIDNIYETDEVLFIHNNEAIALYKEYEKDKTKLKPYKMFKGGI